MKWLFLFYIRILTRIKMISLIVLKNKIYFFISFVCELFTLFT